MRLGGIEAGGTKMVCAIADEFGNILERQVYPTTEPRETLDIMATYFEDKKIDALGIGSFGPVDLNKESATYGYITSTPKPGWSNTDFVGAFSKLGVPVGFDTDVNAAVLGEVRFGAAKDTDCALYITIGTGIGVGVYADGQLYHGHVHPEAGHIYLRTHDIDKRLQYGGNCPFHGTCFEGMASGPSILKRWGKPAQELYEQDEVWELESYYIGYAIANYTMLYSPAKVIVWGGVMHKPGLIEKIVEQAREHLGGYVAMPEILLPALGDNPGIIGATQLGLDALKTAK